MSSKATSSSARLSVWSASAASAAPSDSAARRPRHAPAGLRSASHSRGDPPGGRLTGRSGHRAVGESDYISLHVPLETTTRGLIGGPELARMSGRARDSINTSRGGIMDEAALLHALENRPPGRSRSGCVRNRTAGADGSRHPPGGRRHSAYRRSNGRKPRPGRPPISPPKFWRPCAATRSVGASPDAHVHKRSSCPAIWNDCDTC